MKFIKLIIICVFLLGCTQSSNSQDTNKSPSPDTERAEATDSARLIITVRQANGEIVRLIDHQAGVVCYITSRENISCLPMNLTWLK
jgi:hypothetical protein